MNNINFMRVFVFFDLPTETKADTKNYTIFLRNLKRSGYMMMQFSIYTKIVNVQTKAEREVEKVERYMPPIGNVRVLTVTEKQYQNMSMLLGTKSINEKVNEIKKHIVI
jgi:CRISPR-associated protein Cas2